MFDILYVFMIFSPFFRLTVQSKILNMLKLTSKYKMCLCVSLYICTHRLCTAVYVNQYKITRFTMLDLSIVTWCLD